MQVKGLKDERKRLEEECDGLNALLDNNIQKLKNLERLVRNNESINAKLDKTLHQAENDHQKLIAELKLKNEDAKKAENKLRGINNQINESKITYNNILAQSEKNKAEAGGNSANLSNEIARGKDLQGKIGAVEANIRAEENQLDIIMAEEEKLRKEHFLGLDENKKLNGELDRLLVLINEYELINKELIDEIEIYSDQDQQAIAILSRREQMKELISGTLRKLKLTEETIKHIKY
jgi:chromosome segregation ATPase